MTEIPASLLHFYMNPDGPFRSISELSEPEAIRIMDQMTEANTWHPPRFAPGRRERYMKARRRSEQRLHAAFLEKGGRPQRRHPYYLIPETPGVEAFWPSAGKVRVPVNEISSDAISFTYLDSMVCDALLYDPDRVPENCRPSSPERFTT